MRLVLQRVSSAEVRVDGEIVGRIGRGLLVLTGVEKGDGKEEAVRAAQKLARLRVFDDPQGRMNVEAATVGAEFLVVSQFTLAGSLVKGRRPSFDRAALPETAEPILDLLVQELKGRGLRVATGRFGARMEVELVNDGPVTFVLDLPTRSGR
ncbi:MAG: D-aminoacyl-tRNA deacylase [Thermoanaerobaculia bacterium]